LLTAVRQAVLIWKAIEVVAPAAALLSASQAIGEELRPGEGCVTGSPPGLARGDALVLHIGRTCVADPRVVTVCNSNWIMHVFAAGTSDPRVSAPAIPGSRATNALAAAGASALGIGELFLRTVMAERPQVSYDLSLFDYARSELGALAPGPECPTTLEIHGALIGAGTVSAGFVLALAPVKLHGQLAVVDHDAARVENFGPHLYVTSRTGGVAKVDLIGAQLEADHSDLAVDRKPERFRLFRHRVLEDRSVPFPDVVISGLDKAAPRQQVQRLWAPLHIDMATKDGLQAQVLVRTNPGSGMCIIKKFPVDDERPEEEEIAERTGLTAEALADDLGDITELDVMTAPGQHREALRDARARGERRCNVITGADLADTRVNDEFVGSAPFTALLTGVFAAGELVKARAMGLDRDGTLAMWHFVTTNVYAVRTSCTADCECGRTANRG
jgi:hypothetical protein